MFKIIKSFFTSKNKFQPLYFWITIFSLIIISAIIIKLIDEKNLTDGLILGIMSFTGVLIGLYNFNTGVKK